jgi:hypothetical protein
MGKRISELGVCVPCYDELEGNIVCAFTWQTDAFFLARPIKMHNICGLDEGHTGDHKTSTGQTFSNSS